MGRRESGKSREKQQQRQKEEAKKEGKAQGTWEQRACGVGSRRQKTRVS